MEWKNLEILNLKASRYIFIKEILSIISNNNYSHLKEINLSWFMRESLNPASRSIDKYVQ